MRRLSLLLPLILLLSCNTSSTDSGDDDSGTPFSAFIWGASGSGRHPVAVTDNGDYLVIGTHQFTDTDMRDLQLIKLDHVGNLEWNLDFGGDQFDSGCDIVALSNSTWLLAGSSSSAGPGSRNGWLMKIDHAGDVIWENHYGRINDTNIGAMELLPDGGAALVGSYATIVADLGTDLQLIKTDGEGTETLNRVYESIGNDGALDVAITAAGGFAIVGYNEYDGPDPDDNFSRMWIMKTDAAGDSLWSRIVHRGETCFASGVDVCANGDIVVAAETPYIPMGYESRMRVMRYDSGGTLLWDRFYGGVERAGGRSIRELPNGNLIIAGGTWFASSRSRSAAYIICVNAAGDIVWERSFPVPAPDGLIAYAAVPFANGEIMITGTRNTVNYGQQLWVTRLNAQGEPITID
ncbi:MAG: hypothetical protein GY835_14305 [bacterium]|nr:hypothetical protein [bacterium]